MWGLNLWISQISGSQTGVILVSPLLPGYFWKCLEVGPLQLRRGCPWHLVGRSQGGCSASFSTQASTPTTKNYLAWKVSSAESENLCSLRTSYNLQIIQWNHFIGYHQDFRKTKKKISHCTPQRVKTVSFSYNGNHVGISHWFIFFMTFLPSINWEPCFLNFPTWLHFQQQLWDTIHIQFTYLISAFHFF